MPVLSTPPPATTQQFLLFSQATSRFAIALTAVREVFSGSDQNLATVPNTPSFILGLMNLRGEIVAIADWGQLIGLKPIDHQNAKSRILVLEVADSRSQRILPMRFGLAVSGVEGVIAIQRDCVASSAEVSPALARFLQGLYDLEGRLIMILDVEAIALADCW